MIAGKTLRCLVFKFSEILQSSEIHETWHAIMERHQHAVVQILSHLGQVWVYASHKPELLTTSMMVSVGNVPPLGTKGYPLPLIASKFFSRVNIEQQECCVSFFLIFRGSFGHFYALSDFSMHFMCIIQI